MPRARRNQQAENETAAADETVALDEGTNVMTETTEVPVEEREPTVEELKARVAELEAKLEKKTTKKDKPAKRKHDLPEGYIAPVAFRHELVKRGLASESMSPVQIYSLARKASSNGMPVKHFDKEGNAHDEIQLEPGTDKVLTRPGLKLDEGLEWWQNRPKRQPGQKKEEGEGETPDATDEAEAQADSEEDLSDEDFTEAE